MKVSQHIITLSSVEDKSSIQNLYTSLCSLEDEYPGFDQWYFNKVVPDTLFGKRKIYIANVDNTLAGILILKNSNEKKICTLRVLPQYRRMGIGHLLLDCAIEFLNTKTPLITVSDSHIDEFMHILSEYGFKPTEIHYGRYKEGHCEIVYNGSLNC